MTTAAANHPSSIKLCDMRIGDYRAFASDDLRLEHGGADIVLEIDGRGVVGRPERNASRIALAQRRRRLLGRVAALRRSVVSLRHEKRRRGCTVRFPAQGEARRSHARGHATRSRNSRTNCRSTFMSDSSST